MRRLAPLLFLVLSIYSVAAMANGAPSVYMPLVYNSSPIPTVTPTIAPDAPLPLPNGDFENGPGNWTASNGSGQYPIQHYPDTLPYPANSGEWAARLGATTRDEVWQDVVVSEDRPVLSFWARVYSTNLNCDNDEDAAVSGLGARLYFPLCQKYAELGWQHYTLDLSSRIGEEIQVIARNYSDDGSELWVDDFAWVAQ